MSFECPHKGGCAIAAVFAEAKMLQGVSEETLTQLGRHACDDFIRRAAIAALQDATPEEIASFYADVPREGGRCDNCYQNTGIPLA